MNQIKAQSWLRAIDIVIGLVAVALAVLALTYQSLAIEALIFILSVALLVVGFARFVASITAEHLAHWLRAISAGAGLLTITIAAIAIARIAGRSFLPIITRLASAIIALPYPQLAVEALIFLLAFALLIHGIARIVVGRFAKVFPRWLRGLLVAVGSLTIAFSIVVLVNPAVGALTLVLLLSIALLIIGIESIVFGIKGTRRLEH